VIADQNAKAWRLVCTASPLHRVESLQSMAWAVPDRGDNSDCSLAVGLSSGLQCWWHRIVRTITSSPQRLVALARQCKRSQAHTVETLRRKGPIRMETITANTACIG
jgi:hypothetical protein